MSYNMFLNVKELNKNNCIYPDNNINLINCSNIDLTNIKLDKNAVFNVSNTNLLDINTIKLNEKSVIFNITNSIKLELSNIKEVNK